MGQYKTHHKHTNMCLIYIVYMYILICAYICLFFLCVYVCMQGCVVCLVCFCDLMLVKVHVFVQVLTCGSTTYLLREHRVSADCIDMIQCVLCLSSCDVALRCLVFVICLVLFLCPHWTLLAHRRVRIEAPTCLLQFVP